MKKKSFFQIAVILMASFASWIYCIAVVVLGLIYQAYPGQEHIAVLISTLPTLVMMLSAFASSVLLRFCNRKYVVIISMLISIGAGLLILFLDMPLAGVILCSALLGVPGGTIASANPTVLAEIAPQCGHFRSGPHGGAEAIPQGCSGTFAGVRHRLHFLECLVYELLRLHRQ